MLTSTWSLWALTSGDWLWLKRDWGSLFLALPLISLANIIFYVEINFTVWPFNVNIYNNLSIWCSSKFLLYKIYLEVYLFLLVNTPGFYYLLVILLSFCHERMIFLLQLHFQSKPKKKGNYTVQIPNQETCAFGLVT